MFLHIRYYPLPKDSVFLLSIREISEQSIFDMFIIIQIDGGSHVLFRDEKLTRSVSYCKDHMREYG